MTSSQVIRGSRQRSWVEVGVFPVGGWYASRQGNAIINYGATVSHWGARVSFVDDLELGHFPTLSEEVLAEMDEGNYAYEDLSPEEIGLLAELVDRGIGEGGLGIGFGVTYTPGASRLEIMRLFQLAARSGIPAYIHLRGENSGGTTDSNLLFHEFTNRTRGTWRTRGELV